MADAILEWNLPASAPNHSRAAAIAVVIGLFAGTVGAAVAAVLEMPVVVGAGAGVVVVAAYAGTRARAALRSVRARRASPDAHARLLSLVRGLSQDLDTRPPRVWVYGAEGPNAFAGGGGRGAIAVSEAAMSSLDRTQLEALVAHCLIRLSTRSTRAAALASLAPPVAAGVGAIVGRVDDARAAALTRYPPAVAACIQKADARGGRFGPFFFIAQGPSHEAGDVRIAALADL